MIIEIPIKEPTQDDVLAIKLYDVLTHYLSTMLSKTDARVISDLLSKKYNDENHEDVIQSIIDGVYTSDLPIKYKVNLSMINRFISDGIFE